MKLFLKKGEKCPFFFEKSRSGPFEHSKQPTFLLIFIKKIIDLPRKEGDDPTINDLGAIVKILADDIDAMLGVHVEGGGEDALAVLINVNGDVVATVLQCFLLALNGNLSLLEIKITQSSGQAFVQNGGKKVALELIRYQTPLIGDLVKRVPLLGGSACADQVSVQHLVKRYGKIQIHDKVGLHHDVVDGWKVEGIIDISHKVKNENLYVIHAADLCSHRGTPPFLSFFQYNIFFSFFQ